MGEFPWIRGRAGKRFADYISILPLAMLHGGRYLRLVSYNT